MASAAGWPADPSSSDEMEQWLAVDETAKTMLTRLRQRCAPSIAAMPPLHRAALHGRNVLEIAGSSGSGKSELLLQSAVSCILPKRWEGLELGGSESPVLYLDLDCRFDMRRLVHLLECRIYDAESTFYDAAWEMYQGGGGQTSRTSSNFVKERCREQELRKTAAHKPVDPSDRKWTDSSMKNFIKKCLQRFYLKRCHSSFEFLVALKTIRAHLYEVAAHHGTSAELLIVDSIGAFYWLEKTTQTVSVEPSRKALNLWTVSEAVVNELRQVLEMHPKLLIMVTKIMIFKKWENDNSSSWKLGWGMTSKMYRGGYRNIPPEIFKPDDHYYRSKTEEGFLEKSAHQDFLPATWREFVSHRIILGGPYPSGNKFSGC